MSFWIVNSYGYPNPFSTNINAKNAWEVFLSFTENSQLSTLKEKWEKGIYGKVKSPQGVGSWKPTFEEFGLLYVLNRDNNIVLTDGGEQFKNAGLTGDQDNLWKIGICLLLRYPLCGPPSPPRKGHSIVQDQSNILPYWLLYAAMLELDGYLYRVEIDYIITRIFQLSDVTDKIREIKNLRLGLTLNSPILNHSSKENKGKFYNTMNQIVVHASLNYEIWIVEKKTYPHTNIESIKYSFKSEKKDFIINQMGGLVNNLECDENPSFIDRMPASPRFKDELDYFMYLGTSADLNISSLAQPTFASVYGGKYIMLRENLNYTRVNRLEIKGHIKQLCGIAKGQNLLLNHDVEEWTYKVANKVRNIDGSVSLHLQTGKPIKNTAIKALFDKENG